MARITGKNGKVTLGGTVIATITNWSLDAKIPTADLTAMGDNFKSKGSVIREWSGQLDGHWDAADAPTVATWGAFAAATAASGPTGGTVTLVLYPDRATTEQWTGNAFLDFSMKVGMDKAVDFSAKATGTGSLAYTAPS